MSGTTNDKKNWQKGGGKKARVISSFPSHHETNFYSERTFLEIISCITSFVP